MRAYGRPRACAPRIKVEYPEIEEGSKPRHRFMSAYEQRVETADKTFQVRGRWCWGGGQGARRAPRGGVWEGGKGVEGCACGCVGFVPGGAGEGAWLKRVLLAPGVWCPPALHCTAGLTAKQQVGRGGRVTAADACVVDRWWRGWEMLPAGCCSMR